MSSPELSDRCGDLPLDLIELRKSIDNLDAALVHLLAERFKLTQKVGHLKALHGLPPADMKRENDQNVRLRELSRKSGLDPSFAEKLMNFMIQEVIQNHKLIALTKGSASSLRDRTEIEN